MKCGDDIIPVARHKPFSSNATITQGERGWDPDKSFGVLGHVMGLCADIVCPHMGVILFWVEIHQKDLKENHV